MEKTEEKKEPLFELTEIPETPFMLMHNENGYAILFAEYQITKYYESEEEIKKLIDEKRYRDWETDRKSTRLNSSHITRSRMPSSA